MISKKHNFPKNETKIINGKEKIVEKSKETNTYQIENPESKDSPISSSDIVDNNIVETEVSQ